MKLEVGQKYIYRRTISEKDVFVFAELSGDCNPIHIDELEASKSRFGRRVVHGALLNSFISTVLGTKIDDKGVVYISQTTKFIKPVFIGDMIIVVVEITSVNGKYAKCKTDIYNQNDITVVEGEAEILLPND